MLITSRMTKNPVTVTPEMPILAASALMAQEKIHRVPVLDAKKRLVGVVSEKDILKAMPSPVTTLSKFEMTDLVNKLTVKQIMKKDPATITTTTTVEEAARVMSNEDLSCLCVMENDRLVGIVTKTDLFKMLLEMLGSRQYGTRIEFVVYDKPGVIATISTAFAANGLNIIAFGTFAGDEVDTSICTLKVQGGSIEKIKELMTPFVKEILDIREF